jgi:hypothetical protein
MSDERRLWALEGLVAGLEELRVVLGPQVGPTLEAIRDRLLRAVAARDGGDRVAAARQVGEAMQQLAGLGDRLDPAEGAMMRALASAFQGGLQRGDREVIERSLDVIQSRAGTPRKPD